MATRILDRVRRPRKPITKADSVGPPDDYFGMSELMAQNEGASDNTTDTHATTKRMVWELGPASGERHQVVPKSYEFYREWPIFFAPKTCKFVEIWCESTSHTPRLIQGSLEEHEVAEWILNPRRDMHNETAEDYVPSDSWRLRLICGSGYSAQKHFEIAMPFDLDSFGQVQDFFGLTASYFLLLPEAGTRSYRKALFDEQGNRTGLTLFVRYFAGWFDAGSIAVHYDFASREIRILALGIEGEDFQQEIAHLVSKKKSLARHPLFLPLIFCEYHADLHRARVHFSTERVVQLEIEIGVNDFDKPGPPGSEGLETLDFAEINGSLNSEITRFANDEEEITSNISLLDVIAKSEEMELLRPGNLDTYSEQVLVEMREYCEYLQSWNLDLLARVACQQKIVDGQIQTLFNLLAQRDNKLNFTIAQASKRDSSAMKAIAVVTMVFLPGAYIATLFSMSMFDWHAKDGEHVLSGNFWIYWAFTIPTTAIVLLTWLAWSRPWKGSNIQVDEAASSRSEGRNGRQASHASSS